MNLDSQLPQEQIPDDIKNRIELLKENCIFCKIAKHEIPAKIIYEDDIFMAFLDINPISNGHTILIPKEHYMMMTLVPDEILAQSQVMSKKLSILLKESLKCEDIVLFVPNGQAAGQQIQHFAIHLIPRYEGDEDILASLKTTKEISVEQLKEIHSGVMSQLVKE